MRSGELLAPVIDFLTGDIAPQPALELVGQAGVAVGIGVGVLVGGIAWTTKGRSSRIGVGEGASQAFRIAGRSTEYPAVATSPAAGFPLA